MSQFVLFQNAGTASSRTNNFVSVTNLDLPKPGGVLQVNVLANGGSVSATVVLVGSNDGINGVNAGTVVVSSPVAGATASGSIVSSVPWAFYGAYPSAISGAGTASVTGILNA